MSEKIYKILVLGPQGCGKGTQAEMLASKLNIPNISMGNLLRWHIMNKTEIGVVVDEYLAVGKLAPSSLTKRLAIEWLKKPECQNGFIFDGYPRDREQYDELDNFIKITHALEIWISDEEAIRRISGRRSCICGMTYHLQYKPPKVAEICDKCGAKLQIRNDDQPEAIKMRLGIYHRETEPLLELYKQQGVHIKINGEQPIADVSQEILAKMNLN